MSICQILESENQGTKKEAGCGWQGGGELMGPDYVESEIKDVRRDVQQAVFIFTTNFIGCDIWVHWLSPTIGFQWVEARGAAQHLPMHETAPQQRAI